MSGKRRCHFFHSFQVHAGIFTYSRMRTAACFHANDAFGGKQTVLRKKLGIFFCINIIGDHANAIPSISLRESRSINAVLPHAHRAGNPDFYILPFCHF